MRPPPPRRNTLGLSYRDRSLLQRAAAGVLLVVAIVVVSLVLMSGGSGYTVHFQFESAGQLIKGDEVKIGGLTVGKITDLTLADNGLADVKVEITDHRYKPLHEGTVAGIGTVGLSGITNRFLALNPGKGAVIKSGTTLDSSNTKPLVDIDQVLDSVTPKVRQDLGQGIRESAKIFHGNIPGARRTFKYAQAAISRGDAFASALVRDRYAFEHLIASGAEVSDTIATRESDVTEGITNTAHAFAAVAAARDELTDTLERAPATLRLGITVLAQLRTALKQINPALREAQPVAEPLAVVLRKLVPTLASARPTVDQLNRLLPDLRAALRAVPPTARKALPALKQTTVTLRDYLPLFTALLPYSQDLIQAQLHGLGGGSSFNYDANGHIARIGFGASIGSIATGVTGLQVPLPGFLTGRTNMCAGAASEPPPDGSAPIHNSICDPKQDPHG